MVFGFNSFLTSTGVNAIDYLLKPFQDERFREAISRVEIGETLHTGDAEDMCCDLPMMRRFILVRKKQENLKD